MSFKKFGRLVARVMETLPPEFYPHLANLAVDVEDEADEQTLRDAGFTDADIAEGETAYGMFVPAPVNTEALDLADHPNRLIIYKRPLEEDFPARAELLKEIRKTVIHELAHHFGFTERDLDRFEANPEPFADDLFADI
jgi:predicted Zn-dependent protease with MMP-like domain